MSMAGVIALLGGLAAPEGGLRGVLQHAIAHVVYHAEIELRLVIALLGGLAIPKARRSNH